MIRLNMQLATVPIEMSLIGIAVPAFSIFNFQFSISR
jgi:hypothetical protein